MAAAAAADDNHNKMEPLHVETKHVEQKLGFCSKGREIENMHTNHIFTEEEKEKLRKVESLDYLAPNCEVYREWVSESELHGDNAWDKWFIMMMIGVVVGTIGFLVKSATAIIFTQKYKLVEHFIEDANFLAVWACVAAIDVSLVLVSTSIIVWVAPAASGSGIPEVIGFLNGASLRKIFNIRTLFVKFFSCILSVSSGLPVGPEGPMIHMGSMVGAGVSQTRSKTLGFKCPCLGRFRTTKHLRDFVSAGAGRVSRLLSGRRLGACSSPWKRCRPFGTFGSVGKSSSVA